MKTTIENKLNEKLDRLLKAQEENESMLSFSKAREYLCVSESTLYHLVSDGKIRFYKPNGKLVYFSKAQLNDWIKNRRILKKFNGKSISKWTGIALKY